MQDVWDYKIVYLDFELMTDERLDAYGDDRWELMSIAVLPRERYQFVFRRPR